MFCFSFHLLSSVRNSDDIAKVKVKVIIRYGIMLSLHYSNNSVSEKYEGN